MKNILKNLGLLFLSLVFSLILGEVLVRIIAPQQLIVPSHDIWRPDATVGWRHRENADKLINTGEKTVRFVTDKDGYRISGTEENEENSAPDISIITIGDSFLEAVQVENRNTIPQVVQRTLSDKYHKKVKVINDGVGAWSPDQYLVETGLALAKQSYDLGIIFLYSGNDIIKEKHTSFSPQVVSGRHHFRIPRNLRRREIINSVFYPINDILEENSHLFVLLKNRFQTLRAKLGLTAAYFPSAFKIAEKDSIRWQTTAEICTEIQQVFAEHDTPVFFVLLPAPFQVHEEDFYRHLEMFDIDRDSVDIDQPNKIMHILMQTKSLHLVDPIKYMREQAKSGKSMYGYVDNHLNTEGNEVVAAYIMSDIEDYISDQLND